MAALILPATPSFAAVTVNPPALVNGQAGVTYPGEIFTASNGTAPYTFALTSGSLPSGMTLSSAGTLLGTPTAAGAFNFSVQATDATSATSAPLAVTLTINPPNLSLTPTSLSDGSPGISYGPVTFHASGGNTPYTYSATGLPPGLSINPSSGVLSGTPTQGGTFSVAVTATDSTTGAGSPFSATNFITWVIDKVPATADVISSANPSFVGQSVTFTATVSGGYSPTGTITFKDNGTTLATVALSGGHSPSASFTTSSLTAGSHQITPVYSGDANNDPSSVPLTQNVLAASATATILVSSVNPSTVGQAVTFTATVSSGGGTPTGTITFKDGGTTLATVPLSGVTASFTTSSLTAGSHSITAVYSGDVSNTSSTSSPTIQNVGAVTTATTLSSSANPSTVGQAVTFTATVSSGGGTPAGTVTFADRGATLGTAMTVSGVATFTTSSLATGTHAITASYAGGASFAASTSAVLNQAVNVPADSIRLRQMQLVAAPVIAQNSGQAIAGAIDNAISDGFSGGGNLVAPSGSGIRFNFSADPDDAKSSGGAANAKSPADAYASNQQNRSRVDDAFAAIDRGSLVTKAPPLREQKDWLLWADVSGSGIERWNASAATGQSQLYGAQVNALLGLTRRVTPNFLLGIFGGYENFDYRSTDIGGRLKGDGWTLGTYLGWKLTSSVRFDAAVAYSGIGYDGSAGLAQGNFDGRRWLVSSGFTGTYKALGFDIEPSAKVYVLWEDETAYTDSLGTLQGDRDFATGRASGGVKLIYPFAWNRLALAPYVGLYGDYYFTEDNAAVIVAAGGVPLASTPLLDGWSARVTGGLAAKLSSGATVAFGGELGGIGSHTEIWTARARASLPF